jgi:hypothetical protein
MRGGRLPAAAHGGDALGRMVGEPRGVNTDDRGAIPRNVVSCYGASAFDALMRKNIVSTGSATPNV